MKFNKKAQAAIEFLMTYGWMLLVVLIVGALVFSFVDLGNLLPDQVDIKTQSIIGDSANSAAYGSGANANLIYIAFTYRGGQKATMNTDDITLITNLNEECNAINLSNDLSGIANGASTSINFLSGQPGTVTFNCSQDSNGGTSGAELGTLLSNDVIEGTVSIGVKDSTRGVGARSIPNSGGFRLSIQ